MDGTINTWNVSDGKLKATLSGHKSWVNSIAYSAKGDWLVSGSADGTIIIWSAKSETPLRTIDATKAEVRSIALSPDGAYLAAGLRYGTIKVWSTADWKEHLTIPGSGDMCAVAFSPGGKTLAVSDGDWNRGGVVKVIDVTTGKPVARFQHTGEIISIAFAKTDDVIAVGAADKTVRLWNVVPSR
jgi:WD40 repeat protein